MDTLIAIREPGGSFSLADRGVRPLYSITKTYIAATVISLGVDVERPAADWIEADWLPRGADISVRQLLSHTSGLRDYGALPDYEEAIRTGQPVWSDATFAAKTLLQPLLFEPGSGWSYSNPGFWLLLKIIERETGASFETALRREILEPLALESTVQAHGVFADDLPDYPAGWVWHGLLLSSAADAANFFASEFIRPLRETLTPVPIKHPQWTAPHYGFGLMTEPGDRFGHNGDGPGYSAACFHFEKSGRTACALVRGGGSNPEGIAMSRVLELMDQSE